MTYKDYVLVSLCLDAKFWQDGRFTKTLRGTEILLKVLCLPLILWYFSLHFIHQNKMLTSGMYLCMVYVCARVRERELPMIMSPTIPSFLNPRIDVIPYNVYDSRNSFLVFCTAT